jgi:hypothetical protein
MAVAAVANSSQLVDGSQPFRPGRPVRKSYWREFPHSLSMQAIFRGQWHRGDLTVDDLRLLIIALQAFKGMKFNVRFAVGFDVKKPHRSAALRASRTLTTLWQWDYRPSQLCTHATDDAGAHNNNL